MNTHLNTSSRTVMMNRTGGADVLEIVNRQVPAPKMDEVQIKVHSIGLNRAEIMYRNGQYVYEPVFPSLLGYEASGEVIAVGENAGGFAIGDRVAVIPAFMFTEYGTYGEVVNLPAFALTHIPDNVSYKQAAASYMQYVTAFGALLEQGKLQKGQYVLINAAASSVGIAAIQVAKMAGAVVVALIRRADKKAQLLAQGADYVLTAEDDFAAEVKRITQGKGLHIVFDPVGGANTANLVQAMAESGMYFIYGALDESNLQIGVMDILAKHISVKGYELFEITKDRNAIEHAKVFVNKGLASSALQPLIDREFAFDDIQAAHEYMESGRQIGKILVNVLADKE